MLRTLSRIVFFAGLLSVIALSVVPGELVPNVGVSDKLGHMAAYTALALVGCIAFRGALSLVVLAGGLLLLGGELECAQAFIPGRTASGYDMLANVLGIAFGFAVAISTSIVVNKRLRSLG